MALNDGDGAHPAPSEPGHPIEADPDAPRQIDIEDMLRAPTQAEVTRAELACLGVQVPG